MDSKGPAKSMLIFKFQMNFEISNKIKYLINNTITMETKGPTESVKNKIEFNVRSLMITNVKGAFNKFDTNIISKYLAIANINFKEIKKV